MAKLRNYFIAAILIAGLNLFMLINWTSIVSDIYKMLGLDVFFAHNAIVTLIGFLIYKEWLLCSLADKHRRSCIDLTYKNELIMGVKLYKLCKSIDKEFVDQLEALIQEL